MTPEAEALGENHLHQDGNKTESCNHYSTFTKVAPATVFCCELGFFAATGHRPPALEEDSGHELNNHILPCEPPSLNHITHTYRAR